MAKARSGRLSLGIKFIAGGKTHYGWARLSIGKPLTAGYAVLTGYAYETIADKPIIAGKTAGPQAADFVAPDRFLAPSSEPASLGLLARGADGLNIWRREEDAA